MFWLRPMPMAMPIAMTLAMVSRCMLSHYTLMINLVMGKSSHFIVASLVFFLGTIMISSMSHWAEETTC